MPGLYLVAVVALLFCASAYNIQTFNYTQKIDHFSNSLESNEYKQRYFTIDDFFTPDGPVFLYICGEYTCSVNMDRLFPLQLASQHAALFIALEHRFYGTSQPFADWTLDNLGYLQVNQALADLAHFIQAKNEELGDRKWVIIGCSYPGALSAWFRYKYPHLSVGAISSSGVVNAIYNFTAFDAQVTTSLMFSGQECYDHVANWTSILQTRMEAGGDEATAIKAAFSLPDDIRLDQFMWFVSDIFTISVQYGNRLQLCNYLQQIAPTATYENLATWATGKGVMISDYLSSVASNTTIDPNKNMRQWYYQMCAELGYFQGPSDTNPSRSALLNLTFWEGYCQRIFGEEVLPDTNRTNAELGDVRIAVENLVMLNGVEDPWKGASRTPANGEAKENPTDGINSFELIENQCTDCGHCQELYTPKETDSAKLNATRARVSDLVAMWLSGTQVYDSDTVTF